MNGWVVTMTIPDKPGLILHFASFKEVIEFLSSSVVEHSSRQVPDWVKQGLNKNEIQPTEGVIPIQDGQSVRTHKPEFKSGFAHTPYQVSDNGQR